MIISVDFDGTIHNGIYPKIGSPKEKAVEVLKKLHAEKHYIILNTCRDGKFLVEAINWMRENDIPFDRVNDNHPDGIKQYGNNSRKINADVYIDDKQVGGMPNWSTIYGMVKELVSKKSAFSDNQNINNPCYEPKMKQVEIVLCGKTLLIDEENLSGYYTYDEAIDIAKSLGQRLLTKDEMEELSKRPNWWEDERKGRVFQVPTPSCKTVDLFFPADGLSNVATNAYGVYWSQEKCYLYFNYSSGSTNIRAAGYACEMSVRLAQDI